MDTSVLGRVAALLIRDLSRSPVIFLALARGQELVVSIFDIVIMVVCGNCKRHQLRKNRKKSIRWLEYARLQG
jgi:hypothetical protein